MGDRFRMFRSCSLYDSANDSELFLNYVCTSPEECTEGLFVDVCVPCIPFAENMQLSSRRPIMTYRHLIRHLF